MNSICYASDLFDLEKFNEEIKKYGSEIFPELENSNLINEIISGKVNISGKAVFSRIIGIFTNELKDNISIIFKVLGIAILCSVLKNIQNSFGEGGVSEVAFYVCYILVIVLVITSFSNIVDLCAETVTNLCNFMGGIIPVVIGMLVATGNIATVSMLQPVLIVMIQIVSSILSKVIIPIIFISTIIITLGNISSGVSLGKLGDLLKKSATFIMGVILTIFIGALSLEGTLASSIDGITAKAAKATVSTIVPVVGKILGDAVDSVLGGSVILKNAVGLLGIIVILGIALTPIIKAAILMIIFNVAAVIIEPISDSRITKCMSGVGDSIKILFGIMVTVTFLFIISITLVVKMSNFSIMYR